MADEKLRSLVQKMIDDGADEGTIKETIRKYKETTAGSGPVGQVIEGVRDEAVGQLEAAKTGLAQRFPIQPKPKTFEESKKQSEDRILGSRRNEGPSLVDPTGIKSIYDSNEPGMKKLGRGLVLAAEAAIPFLRRGKSGGTPKPGPKPKAGAVETVTSAGQGGVPGALKSTTDTPLMKGPISPAPTKFSVGRPVAKPEAATTGSGSVTGGMRMTVPATQRPNQFSMSVPDRVTGTARPRGAGAAEVPKAAEVSPANAAIKAEAAAEAAAAGAKKTEALKAPTTIPVRPDIKPQQVAEFTSLQGVEKAAARWSISVDEVKAIIDRSPGIDEGYRSAAQAQYRNTPEAPKTKAALPKETDTPPAPMASAADALGGGKKEVGATKGVLAGFTRQPTKTLAQMVKEYGEAGAATRAGMSVDELRIRIEAGGDPAKLAKGLRDKFGAEKAARLLGESADKVRKEAGGGPSRLPDRAVEGIKAAAEKELKANGVVSEKTQKLLDRIKSERGSVGAKGLAIGGGAVGGGIVGSMMDAKTDEDRIGNTVLGALGGAGLGRFAAGASKPSVKNALKVAQQLRREAFLTGGAIPKNLLTAAGAPVRAAFEGTGSSRLAPAKEMFLAPGKNLASFKKHMKAPFVPHEGAVSFGDKLDKFRPTKWIGAIDDTARDALKRASVPQHQIDRYLLTANNNIFDYMKKRKPEAAGVIDFAFPFQKVPTNVLMEGAAELGHTLTHADMRTALNVLQAGGAYGLGQWAKGDKKKKYIASILLAFAGPNALLSVGAAAQGAGLSGFAAQSLGGTSPIPEQAFDPKSFLGMKPAAVSAIQRLTEK